MKSNQNRRNFLRQATLGSAGLLIVSRSGFSMLIPDLKQYGIGLQLYTVRDAMKKDAKGTLKQVSDIGYKYIELADYVNRKFYGFEPKEFKAIVADLGMEILSSHTQVEDAGFTMDKAKMMAEDHAVLEAKYCIEPWLNESKRKTIDGYKEMVAHWNQVGMIMKDTGIQFGYHNHDFEFDTVEGKIPYFDVFMVEMDKDLITMELDLYWTTRAGHDPVELFNKYPGRFQLFHMKDMEDSADKFFAPVGTGVIDFKRILASKDVAGLKYMIVEQDAARDKQMFDAIRTSINNLTTNILV
jgi:sugar phosphate isomerase/epimerase